MCMLSCFIIVEPSILTKRYSWQKSCFIGYFQKIKDGNQVRSNNPMAKGKNSIPFVIIELRKLHEYTQIVRKNGFAFAQGCGGIRVERKDEDGNPGVTSGPLVGLENWLFISLNSAEFIIDYYYWLFIIMEIKSRDSTMTTKLIIL